MGMPALIANNFRKFFSEKLTWPEKQSGIKLPDLGQGWQKGFEFIMQSIA
jgi:hypothetical protein